MEWRLLDLGGLDPYGAQTLYEAVASVVGRRLTPNTLILCYPVSPYVCIGFHQEVDKEVDIEFCRRSNLPIIRRSQGGGAVYLDSDQQFYQVVARRDDPAVPASVEELFRKFLKPTIHTYNRLGLAAEYKPVNDVVVGGKKISGNGAGELEDAAILVGNIILDINYDSMTRVLKVPNEKFRDKLSKSMKEWVTSLKKELGYVPHRDRIKQLLIEGYSEIGINLRAGKLSDDERRIYDLKVKPRHLSDEWLCMPRLRHPRLMDRRAVKISEGVQVVEADYKARKMIRVTAEVASDRIRDILISGDFFMVPENILVRLEDSLVNASLDRNEILKRVGDFYSKSKVQVPGIELDDFVEAVMKVVAGHRS